MDILEVGAKVDLSDLTAKMEGGARSVEQSTGRMSQAFVGTAAASRTAAEQAAAAGADFTNLGAKGIFAFEGLQHRMIEALRTLSELRAEMLATTSDAERAKLAPDLSRAQAQYTALRTELRGLRMETMESTEKMNLLGNALGIRIPYEMERMVARIPGVQNAMYKLFEASLVVGFAAALVEIGRRIAEVASAWEGYGEAAQKAYEAEVRLNEQAATHVSTVAGQQRTLNDLWKRQGELVDEQNSKFSTFVGHLKEAADQASGSEKAMDFVSGGLTGLADLYNAYKKTAEGASELLKVTKEIPEAVENLRRQQLASAALEDRLKTARIQAAEAGGTAAEKYRGKLAELGVEQEAELRRLASENKLAQDRETVLATFAAKRLAAERDYATQVVNLRATTARQVLEVEEATSKAQAAAENAAYASGVQGAMDAAAVEFSLDSALYASKSAYFEKLVRLYASNPEKEAAARSDFAKFQQEELAHAYDQVTASVEKFNAAMTRSGRSEGPEAEVRIIQDAARQLEAVVNTTGKTPTGLAVSSEQKDTIDSLTKATLDWAKANEVLHNSQLQLQEVTVGGNYDAQIAAVQQAASQGLITQRTAATELSGIYQQEKADRLRILQEQLDAERVLITKAEAELATVITGHDVVATKEAQAQLAQRQAAYTNTLTAMERATIEFDNKIQAESNKLYKALEAQVHQYYSQVTGALNGALTSWLTGQRTFTQAVQQMWLQLARDLINDILRIGEQWVETHLIMAAVAKLFGGNSTQDNGAQVMANAQEVSSADRMQAASDVFLQAIEKVPFPANLAVAPASAAAVLVQMDALAVGAGAGSFRHGGYVGFPAGGFVTGPGTSTSDSIPANLSAGEYVVRADAVKRLGIPALDAMNRGYAAGGPVWGVGARFDVGGVVAASAIAHHGLAASPPALATPSPSLGLHPVNVRGGNQNTVNMGGLHYHPGAGAARQSPEVEARRMFELVVREFRRRNFTL